MPPEDAEVEETPIDKKTTKPKQGAKLNLDAIAPVTATGGKSNQMKKKPTDLALLVTALMKKKDADEGTKKWLDDFSSSGAAYKIVPSLSSDQAAALAAALAAAPGLQTGNASSAPAETAKIKPDAVTSLDPSAGIPEDIPDLNETESDSDEINLDASIDNLMKQATALAAKTTKTKKSGKKKKTGDLNTQWLHHAVQTATAAGLSEIVFPVAAKPPIDFVVKPPDYEVKPQAVAAFHPDYEDNAPEADSVPEPAEVADEAGASMTKQAQAAVKALQDGSAKPKVRIKATAANAMFLEHAQLLLYMAIHQLKLAGADAGIASLLHKAVNRTEARYNDIRLALSKRGGGPK